MKLSKSVLFSLTFASLMSVQGAQAKSLPFSVGSTTGVVKDVYSGIKFHYLDREDRLLIVNDFLKTTEMEYALLPLKKKLIGLDFEKIKVEAIAAETNTESITATAADRANAETRERISFLQAKSNMEFLDRMQMLVAKFQDTHFSIQEKVARPLTYTALRLYRIEGKIVVGSIEKKLLALTSKLANADFSSIAIGDEVIAINDQPVEERVNALKKYTGGSSDEFTDYYAVRGLTIRNYAYDQKNFMTITFKNAGTFKLPIFVNTPVGSTPRLDALTYLNKIGIQADTSTIGLTFDKATKQWNESNMSFEGYTVTKMHLNLKGVVEMIGDDGQPAIRTGYYINKGKTYGVLQLLTFMTRKVKVGENQMSFLDGIRSFVAELKENQLPMILDLRVNGGGIGNYPESVLSILAPDNTIYPGATSGFRLTSQVRQIEEPDFFQQLPGEDVSIGMTYDAIRELFAKSIDNRAEFTPMFTNGPVVTDPKVNGFNNKIVALVTANCISACDKMSYLLKATKRAVIIGTHSNGTGAGFSSSNELNTEWSDRLRVLETKIPNHLFGLPGGSPDQLVFGENSVEELCTENRPTIADIKYNSTMFDLAKNNLGWLLKASAVLETK